MSILKWDEVGSRFYETGVRQAALYVQNSDGSYGEGVAWSGVTSIAESPSGAEATPIYADDTKYLNLYSKEEFKATLEAYTYPDEFMECDGTAALSTGIMLGQQSRKSFGLVYRTSIGNDTDGDAHGYKLHIIYGCKASPSQKSYQTVNDSPEAISFSWEVSSTPVSVNVDGKDLNPTSTVTIDSTKVSKENMKKITDALYGTTSSEPKLLLPDELFVLVGA